MANNFAEAFLGARNAAQDRVRQQAVDQRQQQAFDLQMQGAQQKQQTDQREALYNLATGYKSYISQNPQGGQQYYERFLRPSLAGLGLGDSGPYDEASVNQVADQVIAAYRPQSVQAGLAPRVVGDALVDSTGNVLYQAPQKQDYQWSDRAGAWIPRPMAPQARSGVDPSGQAYNIEPGLSPEDMEAVQADIAASGLQDAYRLPPRAQGGLQAIPVAGIAPRVDEQNAPSGYRFREDGTLAPIPGGPADKQNNPVAADLAKGEMGLRKELQDRIKPDRTVLGMYTNVQNAANNPSAAGDLSMIFAFMKMLDPGSVVREQEFANAQNAAGVPDQVRNAYNRAISGERLNPTQRADFVQQARNLADAAQGRITAVTREYQGIADEYGWDPTRATGQADFRNVSAGPAQAGSQVARPTTEQEYAALPSGAIFIDPEDGKQYRKP